MAEEVRGERIPLLNRGDVGVTAVGKFSFLDWGAIILVMAGLPCLVAAAACYYGFKSVPMRVTLGLLIFGSVCLLTALGVVLAKQCSRRCEFPLNLSLCFQQEESRNDTSETKDVLSSFEYETRPSDYYNLDGSSDRRQFSEWAEPWIQAPVPLMQSSRERLVFLWNITSRWLTEHTPNISGSLRRNEETPMGNDLLSDFGYETRPSDYYNLNGSDKTQSTESGASSVKNKTESEESSVKREIELDAQEINQSVSEFPIDQSASNKAEGGIPIK